jgi:hypothetical protein
MADELNKPSRGTGDWDIPLNQNFDTLEAAARAFLPRGTTQTLNVSDINSDNITNSGTVSSESVDAQFLAEDYLFAGNFAGNNPDSRLSSCLSASQGGETIYLEEAEYQSDFTVSKGVKVIGSSAAVGSGTIFTNSMTVNLDSRGTHLSDIRLNGTNNVNINSSEVQLQRILANGDTVTVDGNVAFISLCRSINLTFTSNSAAGIVDSCSQVTVTDNGNNTVGDIA